MFTSNQSRIIHNELDLLGHTNYVCCTIAGISRINQNRSGLSPGVCAQGLLELQTEPDWIHHLSMVAPEYSVRCAVHLTSARNDEL